MKRYTGAGFTLLELSIVLVIIGLIVGGVLVGRDLIGAAEIRAQISQIEKYKTAVSTFKIKYNCLAGDCANAGDFGFQPAGAYQGERDGNGHLDGVYNDAPNSFGTAYQYMGETALFWRDLSEAGFINSSFNTATATTSTSNVVTTVQDDYFPKAVLSNNHINVWYSAGSWSSMRAGHHYFQISHLPALAHGAVTLNAEVGLTVSQAYNIDAKMDDGLPISGGITTLYLYDYNINGSPSASTSDATTCFHSGPTTAYSIDFDNGAGVNCAIIIDAGF